MNPVKPISASELAVKTFQFQDDGLVPNNPRLPVLVYPGVLQEQPEAAEELFNRSGWGNSWQNGVFDYHHYHGNSHEVLGVMSGSARLQLGGEQGAVLEVSAGDVLVLPAGTGHKRLSASSDFRVAGAYPGGIDYNTRRDHAADHAAALAEIPCVPLPDSDPVYGEQGPLLERWS
ncbi:cupin domain-containing protein [Paenibacillus tengchongensis]|uniref:cupin domain-containing protein n=1 Tax=Paenibacillus tengchongensis TaxID=2608684 RepID=UPI00124D5597|nr:cupin domain-containing protein [Paenibacillus tengchongensis]